MAIDMNQVAAFRVQTQQIEFAQNIQQHTLMTEQSKLAFEACKCIIMLERSVDDVAQFSDDIVRAAYATIERISIIFAPQVAPPPKPQE